MKKRNKIKFKIFTKLCNSKQSTLYLAGEEFVRQKHLVMNESTKLSTCAAVFQPKCNAIHVPTYCLVQFLA